MHAYSSDFLCPRGHIPSIGYIPLPIGTSYLHIATIFNLTHIFIEALKRSLPPEGFSSIREEPQRAYKGHHLVTSENCSTQQQEGHRKHAAHDTDGQQCQRLVDDSNERRCSHATAEPLRGSSFIFHWRYQLTMLLILPTSVSSYIHQDHILCFDLGVSTTGL